MRVANLSRSFLICLMNIGKISPIQLNEKTAYLAGVIIGDGYIDGGFKGGKTPNSKSYRVSIDLTDFEFMSFVVSIIKEIVPTSAKIRTIKARLRGKPIWSFSVSNKSLWYFLTRTLGVPAGKKSRVVTVPEPILTGSNSIRKAVLAGIFDTDGGLKGNSIGITTASKMMCDQLTLLFSDLGFQCRVSSWVIKNYNWRYYALSLYRRDIDRFLKEIPLQNKGKKAAIAKRFNIAAVPKWSNGPVSAN